MRGAGPDDLPFAVVRPLQRWFDQLHIPNTTLFRSEAIANYELRLLEETLFRDIPLPSPTLRSAIGAIQWPLLRVTVPGKALGILPHFAIVAHEVGHALYDRVQWARGILDKEEDGVKTRVAARLGVKRLEDAVTRRIRDIAKNWLEEFAADAFGLFLTGPAFLFSMSDFLQLEGRRLVLSATHPPHDLRRRMLYDRVCTGTPSFAAVFENATGKTRSEDFNSPLMVQFPEKNDVFNAVAKYDLRGAAILAELPDGFRNLQDHIYDGVHACLKGYNVIYSVDDYKEDLVH